MEFLLRNYSTPSRSAAFSAFELQENRLGNVEAAFYLLHRFQHLNGAVFVTLRTLLRRLNPAILRALNRYNQSMGGCYRLYLERYRPEGIEQALSLPSILLPLAQSHSQVGGVNNEMCIRVGLFALHLYSSQLDRIEELVSGSGRYCRKTSLTALWFSSQQMDALVEVSGLMVPCMLKQLLPIPIQFAKTYLPPPGFYPAREVRVRFHSRGVVWPRSLPTPTHPDTIQLGEAGLKGSKGKFEFVDPVSGRRFKVGVKLSENGANYGMRALSFSFP